MAIVLGPKALQKTLESIVQESNSVLLRFPWTVPEFLAASKADVLWRAYSILKNGHPRLDHFVDRFCFNQLQALGLLWNVDPQELLQVCGLADQLAASKVAPHTVPPMAPSLQAPELHFKDAISHGDFVVVGWPHVKVDEPSWRRVCESVATDCAAESKMRLFLKELADEPDPNSMLEKVRQLLGVRCVLSLVCCSLLTLSSLRVLCCWVAMWALLWLSLRRPCLGAARCAHTPAPLQQLSGLL